MHSQPRLRRSFSSSVSSSGVVDVESSSAEETERVAAELAAHLAPGDLVAVEGELGAGKTTFVRGACRALGVAGPVASPTYVIGHRYAGRVAVSHLDLYRLGRLSEDDLGSLEPYFEDAVVFVEWPEHGAGVLPAPRVTVRLRHLGGDHRLVRVESDDKALEAAVSGPC
jgi:tRNA threonylcarbamoyladenosine biosynthesis protein TsaE